MTDSRSVKIPTSELIGCGLVAAVLLLTLAPLPHAAALSAHTWRVELAAAFVMAGWFVIAQLRGSAIFLTDPGYSRRILLAILLMTVWGCLSTLWATTPAAAWHYTIVWIEYALTFALVMSWTNGGLRHVLLIFWFVVAVIGLVCFIDYATLPDFKTLEGTLRLRYSAYGELLVTAVPILWVVAASMRSRRAWLLQLIPAGLGWSTAMLSLSKGVFLAGVVGFFITFTLGTIFAGRLRRRMLVTAGIWILLTLVFQIGIPSLTKTPATVDYISGKADTTRETSMARIFIWRVGGAMLGQHWLLGVGADNFGLAFNDARAKYREEHPNDPPDEPISDFLIERAHNEPLQILAELGPIGLVLAMLPFGLFLWWAYRRWSEGWRPTPLFCAAVGGMAAFGSSSMVSSFSYRIVQNGVTFFIVFAIATQQLSKRTRTSQRPGLPVPAVAILLAVMLLTLGFKAAAEWSLASGDQTADPGLARTAFQRAATLDPDYAAAHYRLSNLAYKAGDYAGAAAELRLAIENGHGVVLTYSALADCYEKAGDETGTLATFKEALSIFPRSVFLRVRHALVLQKLGRTADADAEFAAASEMDGPQAEGWKMLMTQGSVAAFLASQRSKAVAAPENLAPGVAVYQYLDKAPGEGQK